MPSEGRDGRRETPRLPPEPAPHPPNLIWLNGPPALQTTWGAAIAGVVLVLLCAVVLLLLSQVGSLSPR